MATFSTLSFTKKGSTLFTPEEIRGLMRVEFERAQRYGYPIACMLLLVDRLDTLQAIHGYDSREQVLLGIVELMKSETRASDFLGYLMDDRLLTVFPHTSSEAAGFLARRLLAGARKLRFTTGYGTVGVTLSIGLSHNQHPGAISFDTLVTVAEEGLAVADAAGGDRFAETELYQLCESRHQPQVMGPSHILGNELERLQSEEGEDYRRKLLALVARDGDLEAAAAQLAEEIIGRAMREVDAERGSAVPAAPETPQAPAELSSEREARYQREIDTLQRRIAKLSSSLGLTEQELLRIRALKGIDDGVASIYRDVQGLSMDDIRAELKKELMSKIFEANLDLRRKTG